MAKIRISGDTSGYVELAAPAVAGSSTFTLPTGTVDYAADVASKLNVAGGKILQTQLGSLKTTGFTTSSTSFVDVTDLNVTITPSSDTSKIFVMSSFSCGTLNASTAARITIARNGTDLHESGTEGLLNVYPESASAALPTTVIYLDSPGSTSALTYQVRAKGTGGVNLFINQNAGGTFTLTTFVIAFEVSA